MISSLVTLTRSQSNMARPNRFRGRWAHGWPLLPRCLANDLRVSMRPVLGVANDTFRRAERQRLNRHRGVVAATSDKIAAVHDKQVRDIMRLVELVDHGGL